MRRDIVLLQAEFNVLPLIEEAKVQNGGLTILDVELELPVERPEPLVELLLWPTCVTVGDAVALSQYV